MSGSNSGTPPRKPKESHPPLETAAKNDSENKYVLKRAQNVVASTASTAPLSLFQSSATNAVDLNRDMLKHITACLEKDPRNED